MTTPIGGAPAGSGLVLVVDDEPDLRMIIKVTLEREGWRTCEAADAASALECVSRQNPDAVTLDVNLGLESGYDVCRSIRSISSVPVIFLTARTDSFDHALGLELGADGFLTKPFNPRVLAAQVAAAVRRGRGSTARTTLLRSQRLTVDLLARSVHVDGVSVNLSKTEFDLLCVLMESPGRVFEHGQLLTTVWGEWYSDNHVLEVTIGRLRRKLSTAGASTTIETVRGVGYRFSRDG
jgi:DNA-binding response OmpR family regulator